jgi:predicted transcriptional regulator
MGRRASLIPDAELDVLKVVWRRGRGTVREVLADLHAEGSGWSYATVATLLDRLENRGMVRSDRSELAYVYEATVTPQEIQTKGVENLVEKLYQGEPGLLVMHLLKAHPLPPEQAREVKQLLDEMGSPGKSTK